MINCVKITFFFLPRVPTFSQKDSVPSPFPSGAGDSLAFLEGAGEGGAPPPRIGVLDLDRDIV